jgi:hypothetical protein
MKKVFVSLLFILFIANVSAQYAPQQAPSDQFLTNRSITFKADDVHFTGSAYENKEFVAGSIFKKDQILASNVLLRYNAFRDEIEVKSDASGPDASAKVMVRNPDIYVKLMNKMIVFSGNKEGIDRPGYFMVVAEGNKVDLYKKIKKEFIEGSVSMSSLTRDIPSTYKEKEIFYMVDKTTGAYVEFPSSKNAKFNLFKDKKKQVKNYASQEGLNVNKESALKKVILYYDTL